MKITYPPLFIIGNPRSGTSLFRLLLTCHPNIIIPPESSFMIWWYDKYGDWSKEDVLSSRLDKFLIDLLGSKKIEFWKLDKEVLTEQILKETPANYTELMDVIYWTYVRRETGPTLFWGDKNNYYLGHVDSLLKLYPKAKFIHIIRDGRDVATSYMGLNKIKHTSKYAPRLPNEIREIAKDWNNNIKKIHVSFQKLPETQRLEVKYESLADKPVEFLEKICAFLNISYSSEMLNFYEKNQQKSLEPEEFNSWKKRNLKNIDTSAVGKYKTQLSKEEISNFEEIAHEVLKLYNYIC